MSGTEGLHEMDLGNGIIGYYRLNRVAEEFVLERLTIEHPTSQSIRALRFRDIARRPRGPFGFPDTPVPTRGQDESAAEFSARIARVHAELVASGSPSPTKALAYRAGVSIGIAACWVSRARARGVYPPGLSDTSAHGA